MGLERYCSQDNGSFCLPGEHAECDAREYFTIDIPDILPLMGHHGLAVLVGEAISEDVDTYELGRDEHYTTLLVDWRGQSYVVTIERKCDSPEHTNVE